MIVKYNRTETMAFLATPILSLDLIMRYKNYCVYSLDTVLEQEDKFFFSE